MRGHYDNTRHFMPARALFLALGADNELPTMARPIAAEARALRAPSTMLLAFHD